MPTTPSFRPWLPDGERPPPQRPGSPQRPQPPQEPWAHSVSFVKPHKVLFEKTVCQASQGVSLGVEVEAQSQQTDPKPWQGQPSKGSHSVGMSQDWHPSSTRVAEAGFIGKSEEGVRNEEKVQERGGKWGRRQQGGVEEPVFQVRENPVTLCSMTF